ncbi:MAG: hypothetical protein AAGA38_03660 [Pseudomonadota bacterium]
MDGILPQLLKFALLLAAGAGTPGALIAWFFGGRWVWRLWLVVMAGIVLWLIWFFGLSERCCPTGMEGLALFIWPLLGLGIGVGLWLGYAVATILKDGTGRT